MRNLRCVACGRHHQACPGHHQVTDPGGHIVQTAHNQGRHAGCHPYADCKVRA